MAKNAIYELKNQRAGLLDEAGKALDSKNLELYNAKLAEVKKLNGEIEAHESLDVEEGRFDDTDAAKVSLAEAQATAKAEAVQKTKSDAVRSTPEYTNAFINAVRNGTNFNTEDVQKLKNAMTESGGTPVGADGGFLVPVDMETMINEFRRSFTNLLDFVQVENVTTLSGSRVLEVGKVSSGFPEIDEGATLTEVDTPKFKMLNYKVKKYGGYITLTAELIADESANLMAYLSRWMARKSTLTDNALILAQLNLLTATTLSPADGLNGLKAALNVTLDPDISNSAIILTNQSGFNYLDTLDDADGRGLLQPNPAVATGKIAQGRQVVVVSNTVLPNGANGAPIFVGDIREYATFFNRMSYEMDSTMVGGNAWRTHTTEVRGLLRRDIQLVDTESVVKLEVPV